MANTSAGDLDRREGGFRKRKVESSTKLQVKDCLSIEHGLGNNSDKS